MGRASRRGRAAAGRRPRSGGGLAHSPPRSARPAVRIPPRPNRRSPEPAMASSACRRLPRRSRAAGPEYAPVLSRAVPVPGFRRPFLPSPAGSVRQVPCPSARRRFRRGSRARASRDPPEPGPRAARGCASAVTGQSVAAPARAPVPTHLHAVRFMTVAFPVVQIPPTRYGPEGEADPSSQRRRLLARAKRAGWPRERDPSGRS